MKYTEKLLHVLIISCTIGFWSGVAYGEETKAPTLKETINNVSIWVQDIPNKPAKIQAWASNEWQDIKEYQAKGWAEGKEQNAKNFDKVKKFFGSLINNDKKSVQ